MILSYSDVAIALGAVTLATLSGSALHQNCAPIESLARKLAETNQNLTATGWTASNDSVNLFVNPGTGHWTLTLTGPNELACPIARGTRFEEAEIDGYLTPVTASGS